MTGHAHTYAPMHTPIISFGFKNSLFLNDCSRTKAFTVNLVMIRNRNSQITKKLQHASRNRNSIIYKILTKVWQKFPKIRY